MIRTGLLVLCALTLAALSIRITNADGPSRIYSTCAGGDARSVYDVGSFTDGTFHEYTSIHAIVEAMIDPTFRPPAAIRWQAGTATLPGYWAGPGYDPCLVGYPVDGGVQ